MKLKEILNKLRKCSNTSASKNTLLEKIVYLSYFSLFNFSGMKDNHFNTPFTTRTFFYNYLIHFFFRKVKSSRTNCIMPTLTF